MRKLSAWALIFLLTFALCLPVLRAETEDEIWKLVTQEGIALTRIGTKVSAARCGRLPQVPQRNRFSGQKGAGCDL